jgi:hypothetical protein
MGISVNYTWSYSSISLFQQCPRKYHRLRVVKDIVEPPQDHLIYGTAVHAAAEEYIRDGTPIPEKYAFIQEYLDPLKELPGIKLCEHEMGLTKDLKPCTFRDPNVWFRGIADLLVINGDKARIIDYKTSKSSRYADKKQLELLSLLTFKHFPEVKQIKAGLLFLVIKDLVAAEFTEDQQPEAWGKWIPETNQLESAMITDVWNPKPNFTCRGWCPITDCEHNGRNPF